MDKQDVIFVINVDDNVRLPCPRECRMRSRTGVNFARSETVEAEAGIRVGDFAMVVKCERRGGYRS